jgi:DNA-binding XRE family transcriptional regulator
MIDAHTDCVSLNARTLKITELAMCIKNLALRLEVEVMRVDIQRFLDIWIKSGKSIREIAKTAGLSPSTISRIANGKVVPDIKTLQAIIEPYGYELRIELKRGGDGSDS